MADKREKKRQKRKGEKERVVEMKTAVDCLITSEPSEIVFSALSKQQFSELCEYALEMGLIVRFRRTSKTLKLLF